MLHATNKILTKALLPGLALLLLQQTIISGSPCRAETHLDASTEVISLNNEGVKALNAKDLALAIDKFTEALKLDPGYRLAKANLAITYRYLGESLTSEPAQALKAYRKALLFNFFFSDTRAKVDELIQKIGRDPHDYKQRMELAEEAVKVGDYPSAVIEFAEALRLRLHNDPEIRKKLDTAYNLLPPVYRSVEEKDLVTPEPLRPSEADPSLEKQPGRAVVLNNEGVAAIKDGNFQLAIDKLTKALREAPNYVGARQNLSIAHSGNGAALMAEPKKALEEFHKAMLLDLASDSKRYDVNRAVIALGLNAGSYEDRLALCDTAVQQHDYVSAVIECSEALRLHDAPDIRNKLWLLSEGLDPIYQSAKYTDLLPKGNPIYQSLSKFFPGLPDKK